MKILFTGGGTAGHIFPIIEIVRQIKKINPKGDFQFFYIGPKDDFAKDLLSKEGIEVKTIFSGKIRRYFSFLNIIDILFKLPIGFLQAFYYVFVISPDIIFSKGGYGSIPVVITGWMLLTPVFIHESDVAPGLANRIASKIAVEIFTSFPVEKTLYFPAEKMFYVGNPVRESLISRIDKEEAKKLLHLTGKRPVIFIIGGSQGAQKINDTILVNLSDFLKEFEIIHQTGRRNFEQVQKEARVVISEKEAKYYHPFPFLNEKELSLAYHCADLIISRGGAGVIFEISAVGKPSIIVPISGSAQNHQVRNAYAFAENGAAVVIEEENFLPHFLLKRVEYLFSKPALLRKMAKKAKEFSKPDAGRIIAEYLIAYLTQ